MCSMNSILLIAHFFRAYYKLGNVLSICVIAIFGS